MSVGYIFNEKIKCYVDILYYAEIITAIAIILLITLCYEKKKNSELKDELNNSLDNIIRNFKSFGFSEEESWKMAEHIYKRDAKSAIEKISYYFENNKKNIRLSPIGITVLTLRYCGVYDFNSDTYKSVCKLNKIKDPRERYLSSICLLNKILLSNEKFKDCGGLFERTIKNVMKFLL